MLAPAVVGAVSLGAAAPAAATPLPASPVQAAPPTSATAAGTVKATTARAAPRAVVRTAPTRAVATTAAATGQFRLERGDRGPHVVKVQKRLSVSPTTGYFGPRTEAAVKRFQAGRGIPATGIVSRATWLALKIGPVPATPPAPPTGTRPKPGTPAFGALILRLAMKHQGKPYRYGTAGPATFDCSGLTSWVYREAGYLLPRSSGAQRAATRSVATPVPGDLGFVRRGGVVRHVGIYVGDGRWFEASTRSKPIGFGKARWGSNISFGRVG